MTGAPVSSQNRKGSTRTVALNGLLVLAVFYTLYLARGLFIPVFLAVLFGLLLTPVVRLLERIHIPSPAGAGIILLALLGTIGFAGYQLAGPAQEWVAQAPQSIAKARAMLRRVMRPVEVVRKTAEQVQQATNDESGKPVAQAVTVRETPELLFGTQAFLVGFFEMAILLYFLLAAGPMFTQKVVKVLPRLRDKEKAISIAREVEGSVSRYLLTIATINVIEGAVIAVVMYLLGMPNPPLWGALCALLIFIPYIGALTMMGVLFLVAITTFDSIGRALAAPGIFFVIDVIQANVVAPHVLGRRMTLNPVAIFVSVLLWGEIWGVAGVFMAVPLLVVIKILCDHVQPLASVGEFLGR